MPDEQQASHDEKPLFLLRGSPLVSGGKARLMSGKKVEPKRATPREISGPEAHGYTSEPGRALRGEPECLGAADWDIHVGKRSETVEEQRRRFEAARIEEERRLLTVEQRLVTAHEEARRRCIDVSSEAFVLRRMLAAGKNVRHMETRLGSLERKVWRDLDEAA